MKHFIYSLKSKLFYFLSVILCFSLSVAHAQDLPAHWENKDIGDVATAGSASFDGGVYTINGSGADIYGIVDAFHFAYQPAKGDCEISAYVASVSLSDQAAKAGVMIRETLDSTSSHAMAIVTAGLGTYHQYRLTTDGTSDNNNLNHSQTQPVWVKLIRRGDYIVSRYSLDGEIWIVGTTDSIEHVMAEDLYIGLCVTAHNNDGSLCEAVFENVELETGIEYPSAVNDIKTNGLSVYPNPVTDILTVDLGKYNLTANSTITIYNQLGQLLKEEKVTQIKQPVDLSDYSQGIYFIQYVNGQESIVQKIAKE